MSLYFEPDLINVHASDSPSVRTLVPVTTTAPFMEESPSPWMRMRDTSHLNLCDLDTPPGRELFAQIMEQTSLYRMSLELLIDHILTNAKGDDVRTKTIIAAFAPEDVPETVIDPIAAQYDFAGTLKHPAIASFSALQLLELYLRLYGAATPEHKDIHAHLAQLVKNHPAKLLAKSEGLIWRGRGWVRLDSLIYNCERADHDPGITFESYVTRGRQAAEKLTSDDVKTLLAAWLSAEHMQESLCLSIDNILSLPDLKRLPRWVRADVFRILEREAMKQVFAAKLHENLASLKKLKLSPLLAEPIATNARGDVSPLIQQLLNQTLAVDGNYSGGALSFANEAAQRRNLANIIFAA